MLRILLVDDHEVVRKGLREILEQHQGWKVCGEAANGRDAITKAVELKPEVALVDLEMPELNGLEATRQIKKDVPAVKVLVYSVHETDQFVREAVRAGAHGYVRKSYAGRHIISAVEALSKQRCFFATTVGEEPFHDPSLSSAEGALPEELTSRESQIVQLLTKGRSNREVASILGISVKTVETHRTTVMRKLGVHSIVKLVHYAVRNNLVSSRCEPMRSEIDTEWLAPLNLKRSKAAATCVPEGAAG
jgi:DNA-binding NarL/FixJ family response regulator